jgi:hypothetical protein
MLYHEKTEHEKTCSRAACSGGIAGRVVKMGPCGGGGGNATEMDVRGVNRIVKVVVWHDIMVDGMLVFYELNCGEMRTKQFGLPWVAKRSEVYPSLLLLSCFRTLVLQIYVITAWRL